LHTQWYDRRTTSEVYSIAVSGTNLFAGTLNGVFLSNHNGSSWIAVKFGLTNTAINALAVSGTNLFAGTFDGGVWRRPLSEMTAVKLNESEIPTPSLFRGIIQIH
jgi:hypothetical protein